MWDFSLLEERKEGWAMSKVRVGALLGMRWVITCLKVSRIVQAERKFESRQNASRNHGYIASAGASSAS